MKNNTNEQRDAISGWEDEGGAATSDQRGKESDQRGKEIVQTVAEQTARRNRDDLKRRLAGRLTPAAEKKLRRK